MSQEFQSLPIELQLLVIWCKKNKSKPTPNQKEFYQGDKINIGQAWTDVINKYNYKEYRDTFISMVTPYVPKFDKLLRAKEQSFYDINEKYSALVDYCKTYLKLPNTKSTHMYNGIEYNVGRCWVTLRPVNSYIGRREQVIRDISNINDHFKSIMAKHSFWNNDLPDHPSKKRRIE